jgi:hypothetical protein
MVDFSFTHSNYEDIEYQVFKDTDTRYDVTCFSFSKD